MYLEMVKKVNVDFYNNKLIYINVKQSDSVRYILATCYDNGNLVYLDKNTYKAYIRGRKPDDSGIFNSCEITSDGDILIALTQNSLSVSGIMTADIIIYCGSETEQKIISTMPICLNIVPTALMNSNIESSDEYMALNDLMVAALSEYDSIVSESKYYHDSIQDSAHLAQSYAVGNTGLRDGEETDNAKYFYELSREIAGNFHIASVDEIKEYLGIS